MIPFTEDMASFKEQLCNVRAAGGQDEPEDVFGGLEAASELDWSTSPTACRQVSFLASCFTTISLFRVPKL